MASGSSFRSCAQSFGPSNVLSSKFADSRKLALRDERGGGGNALWCAAPESWGGRSLPGDGGLEQHAGAVVVEVAEAAGGAVDVFDLAVEGLDWA